MTIISRVDWQARPARSTTGISGVKGVAGHWEGVELGAYSHSECPGKLRQIQNYHMDKNKWVDIAYSMVVCRHGSVYVGRGPGVRSAANGTNDANAHYYAICVLMGPGDDFTAEAHQGFLEARQYLIDHGGAGKEVKPHRAFIQTQCPGGDIASWIEQGFPSQGGVSPGQPSNPTSPPASTPGGDPYSVEAEVAALPVVQKGSSGQHVRICQGLLVANGRVIPVDGDFGPTTDKALREWQGAVGLEDDGVCGPKTWRRLLCI